MADALRLPFSSEVILDDNGDPANGAKIEVFESGTSTPLTVYSDSDLMSSAANPIVCGSGGVCPVRYINTSAWKATFKDSADATITRYTTLDSEPGAVDHSSYLTGTVEPSRSVISKTTTYTTDSDDLGKEINCDASGGDFTITLLSAVTATDGGSYVIKNSASSGNVTVSAGGGQTIDGQTSHILNPYDSITVNSDGANWHIQSGFTYTDGIVTLAYSASITPDFAYPAGTDFQVTLTGSPTINNPSNVRTGMRGTITVIQDGTGNREITWGANFNGTVQLNLEASAVTVIGFHARSSSAIDYWTENIATGYTHIEDQTASSDSTLDFSIDINNYNSFYFELENILPATDGAVLGVRLRRTGQGSVDSSAADYVAILHYVSTSGPTLAGVGTSENPDMMLISTTVTNAIGADGDGLSGEVKILNPGTSGKTIMIADVVYEDEGEDDWVGMSAKGSHQYDSTVDTVQFVMDTGNIASGNIHMWGLKKDQ